MLRPIIDKLVRGEDGQTLVEYGLVLSLIAITAIGGMSVMGGEVNGLYGVLETVAEWLGGNGGT